MNSILRNLVGVSVLGVALAGSAAAAEEQVHYDKARYLTPEDKVLAKVMSEREADWRNGAVVYQVIVDRFAPSERLEEKKDLYKAPRALMNWSDMPAPGHPVEGIPNWSHELEFWGGDLDSLMGKLDYIDNLGVDVVYLNPIFDAYTNHKYDAADYMKVSKEYGTRDDVRYLAALLHASDMHLVLDGVFNHMGWRAPVFIDAKENPESPYRDWFFISDAYGKGHRSWVDSGSLPELRLENPKVQDYIYKKRNSVVRSYLRDGIDGWRLDVAFDVGPKALSDITEAAHKEKPGALVIGEIWSYPDGWAQSLDGIMNFPLRSIVENMLAGKISGPAGGDMIAAMAADTPMDSLLKSWLVLDNHDTKRLTDMLAEKWQRTMAQTLQFTLPGSPNLYYGTELGMTGGDDPANRAPMRWDLVSPENKTLARTKALIDLRASLRALKIGNYRPIVAEKLLAFERYTDRALESVFILANPSDQPVTESVLIRNWKMMNGTKVVNALTGEPRFEIRSALMDVALAPHEILVLKPVDFENEWTPYERLN